MKTNILLSKILSLHGEERKNHLSMLKRAAEGFMASRHINLSGEIPLKNFIEILREVWKWEVGISYEGFQIRPQPPDKSGINWQAACRLMD